MVHSKVRSPAIRPSTLERPRLLNWLERHASARLRVIAAEAGYGKSTLLADHARRSGRRTLWYRLEPSDRDWVTFLSYVVASVREIAPSFGAGTVSLLQQVGVLNTTRDLTLDTLLAELESVATEPLSLILDDFHAVQDSDDVRAIVVRLLEHAPTGFSLVIASRDRPTFPMARLSAQAGVAELATEDLRFTRSETADLFAYSYGTPIDDDLVAEIDERLEGWGSSLQLVGASLLSLRPEEIRTFVRDLSAHSEPLRDFLVEEVLSRQTPVMRRVLIHASLLERISPHLLAAATADPRPMSVRQITVCLYRAEDTGMITPHRSRQLAMAAPAIDPRGPAGSPPVWPHCRPTRGDAPAGRHRGRAQRLAGSLASLPGGGSSRRRHARPSRCRHASPRNRELGPSN